MPFSTSTTRTACDAFLAVETQSRSAPTVPEPCTIGLVMLAIGFLLAACMRFPRALSQTIG
jgi:hypothetical protein